MLLLLAASLAVLAFGAAPARAAVPTHPWVEELSEGDEGLSGACGVDVDDLGYSYVLDYNNNVLRIYNPSGGEVTSFTVGGSCNLAVDSAGNVYTEQWQGPITRYKPSSYPPTAATSYTADASLNGTGILDPGATQDVAVDPTNDDVYVSHDDHVARYSADGTLISDEIASEANDPFILNGLDIHGESGLLFVYGETKVYVFDPATGMKAPRRVIDGVGTPAGGLNSRNYGEGLAVDQRTGHVFIWSGNKVHEFESSGAFVSQIDRELVSGFPSAIAVDNSGGDREGHIFVAGSPKVDVFEPAAYELPTPTAVTGTATEVTQTTAKLSGNVDPRESPTIDCHFEWGPAEGDYSSGSAPCSPMPTTKEADVSAEISGLTPNTEYHFRVVIETAGGTASGEDATFISTIRPIASTEPAGPVDHTTAVLHGTVNPTGAALSDCHFEWGPIAGVYNAGSAPCDPDPGAADEPVAVSAQIDGLTPNSKYHFRVVAENVAGSAEGGDESFETVVAPTAVTNPPTDITAGSGTMRGTVNPNGGIGTECRFEWGTSTDYEYASPCEPAPESEKSPVAVSRTLHNLEHQTTYHYRVVIETNAGTAVGLDQTLTTGPAAPVAFTGLADSVSQTQATLRGWVNPRGAATVACRIEWGTDAADYDAGSAPCSPNPGAVDSQVKVSADAVDLEPNTTYFYRVVHTTAIGTHAAAPRLVTTLPLPPVATTGTASDVTTSGAVLNGAVEPQGAALSVCRFEYGPGFSSQAPCSPDPSGATGSVAVTAAIGGLLPGTFYPYRLVVRSAGGESVGAEASLTTLSPPPPPAPTTTKPRPKPAVKCRKGFVKRKGKCVKKRAKRKKARKHRGSKRGARR